VSADYTGLPGWYVLDLCRPALVKMARAAGAEGSEQELLTAGGTILSQRCGPSKAYMHDLANYRLGICGLHMSELILGACGIPIATVRDDMFIPFRGFRCALRMASDELYALRVELTEQALLDRANYLADRRDLLLSMQPRTTP
jgi:hypothetical protein